LKLMAQLFAAIIVCVVGIRIQSIAVSDGITLNFGWFSWPITILWIVGITNAVNLSDGLDGLAAGISAIACGIIAFLAIYSDQTVLAVLMLALLGSLSGFLVFNFNPARIFMGDCGSLFLGFVIASVSVLCSMKSTALVGLTLPMLALGIPIFDTLFSMLRRFLERRSIFSPDRSHFHHRLVDMGLKQRHVVLLIYALTAIIAGLGMFMILTRDIRSLAILSCILLLIIFIFHVIGSVRLHETIAGLRKKFEFVNQNRHEQMNFEQAQLCFRNARTFNEWWQVVCEAAKRMDFAWISLKTTNKDGVVHTEIWRPVGIEPNLSNVVIMNVPLCNYGNTRMMRFEIAILVNGSLESASHRATLFNRLIEEHNAISVL
jgi:UDP-GlcNAc:undecaprenyl-phosphate GlcNAc-1-phosphate transferase